MYIWTAINIESQLTDVKDEIKNTESRVGIKGSVVNLPLHVSLKISFYVSDDISSDVIRTIIDFFENLGPFYFEPVGIEKEGTIVWIRMKDSEKLSHIHYTLDQILLDKFNVIPHKFDLEYKFHATLYMDSDVEKISCAYEQIKDIPLPKKLTANHFVIGTSETGAPGTYKVAHNIKL